MIRIITRFAVLLALLTVAAGLAITSARISDAGTASPAVQQHTPAAAAQLTARDTGWFPQDRAACAAFRAFLRHGTAARFAVLYRDSRTADWHLGTDTAWWREDRRHHAGPAEIRTDIAVETQDCDDPELAASS
jgi:hypothetical protein